MRKLTLVGVILILATFSIGAALETQGASVSLPLCSSTIHAKYKTLGPDGVFYPSWHPAIDTAHNCYHGHEHGSNPAFATPGVGWSNTDWPAFGYTAAKHGMSEGHAGFKIYYFRAQGVDWLITQHMGTGNAMGASCNRYHTLDVQARQAGVLLADIHLMGDFGKSVINQTPSVAFAPAACPTQGSVSGTGVRQLPAVSNGNIGYEPWRVDRLTGNVLGFVPADITFNTLDPQTACDDASCGANVARSTCCGPARGANRLLTLNAPTGISFGFVAGQRGTFYTDPEGREFVDESDPAATRQYIAEGFTFALGQATGCVAYGADYFYVCGTGLPADAGQYLFNPFVTGSN